MKTYPEKEIVAAGRPSNGSIAVPYPVVAPFPFNTYLREFQIDFILVRTLICIWAWQSSTETMSTPGPREEERGTPAPLDAQMPLARWCTTSPPPPRKVFSFFSALAFSLKEVESEGEKKRSAPPFFRNPIKSSLQFLKEFPLLIIHSLKKKKLNSSKN